MVIINLPASELDVVPCGPAVLKGIAESQGYKINTWDTNLTYLHKFCKGDIELFYSNSDYWLGAEVDIDPTDYYEHIYQTLQTVNTRFLGISVFSTYTHMATEQFLNYIKDKPRNYEIVLGGKGCTTRHINATKKDDNRMFWQIMKDKNLYDKTLLGDTEDSILHLLSNDYEEAIFPTMQTPLDNKLKYPFSNFDDCYIDAYQGEGKTQIPVYTSKGCVRACDFCDVAVQFGKFQQKDAHHLFHEMKYLANRYNIYEFASADSIANGNMKALNTQINLLAEYNRTASEDKKIRWTGNWIARPRKRSSAYTGDFYDRLKESGCVNLTIGAEAMSDHVLLNMSKKTDVDGFFYELENLDRVGIGSEMNIIVGHWSERYEDFLTQLETFIKLGPMIAKRTITTIKLAVFSVLDDTPSSRDPKLEYSGNNFTQLCWHPDNPELTYKEKIARFYCTIKFFDAFGIDSFNKKIVEEKMRNRMLKDKPLAIDFFKDKPPSSNPSVHLMDNIVDYTNKVCDKIHTGTEIQLQLDSYSGLSSARIHILYGSNTLFYGDLQDGINKFNFKVDYIESDLQHFSIQLIDKTKYDSKIDSSGNLIFDKHVLITGLTIDTINVFDDQEYYYKKTKYIEHGQYTEVSKPGLWMNDSKLIVEFKKPFWRHYLLSKSSPWPGLDVLKELIRSI